MQTISASNMFILLKCIAKGERKNHTITLNTLSIQKTLKWVISQTIWSCQPHYWRELSSWVQWLLLERSRVQNPELAWRLTNLWSYCFKESDMCFWPLWLPHAFCTFTLICIKETNENKNLSILPLVNNPNKPYFSRVRVWPRPVVWNGGQSSFFPTVLSTPAAKNTTNLLWREILPIGFPLCLCASKPNHVCHSLIFSLLLL